MTFDDVRRALALPRPGRAAHQQMFPRLRPGDEFPIPADVQLKEAGVLILLYPNGNGLHFFLTRRTETVETHKGQISLPGGAQEPGEALQETALREASEELGIDPAGVELVDSPLTPITIPVSGFRVTPFVGITVAPPSVSAAAAEVVEIIETPLDLIVDEKNIREEEWELRERTAVVRFFDVNGYKVWGATAMILNEFAEMLRAASQSGDWAIGQSGDE